MAFTGPREQSRSTEAWSIRLPHFRRLPGSGGNKVGAGAAAPLAQLPFCNRKVCNVSGVLDHGKTVLHLAAEKGYISAMKLAC